MQREDRVRGRGRRRITGVGGRVRGRRRAWARTGVGLGLARLRTVKVSPAIVSVPVRGAPRFAAALTVTEPFPVPVASADNR